MFNSITVIKKDDNVSVIPLFCPLCEIIMSKFSDIEFYNEWEVCSSCAMIWAEANRDRWKTGWRPKIKEISKKS